MLPKPNRIPSHELRRVLRRGKRVMIDRLDVHTLKTTNDVFRCAIIVPVRVDKRATVRNRIRRLLSESVRNLLTHLPQTYDLALRVRGKMPDTQSDVDRMVHSVLVRTHIVSV